MATKEIPIITIDAYIVRKKITYSVADLTELTYTYYAYYMSLYDTESIIYTRHVYVHLNATNGVSSGIQLHNKLCNYIVFYCNIQAINRC